ncbi:MAG: hypothetical protein IAA96_08355 [Spirochaetes bacterium]|uniref:Lipocalin-like domain-containing protein n=1 Tax=Candidatus Avitreponema avistercoris TaxID=2840705 RepID=A0A9D9EQY5_9SPIR|nr:hypothetical protein [Candidatus Avitreponema avistercoris]
MKQKTLFACLAAFAAVFAFSACDGFDDDDTPINEYVAGSWRANSSAASWTLSLTQGGAFNLSGYDLSSTSISPFVTLIGDYYGDMDRDDVDGDMDLWGEDGSQIEINYHRGLDRLSVESVFSSKEPLRYLYGVSFSRQ